MARRKTTVAKTREALNAEDLRSAERADRPMPGTGTGLLSLDELRARRGQIDARELLTRCRRAAARELRGAMFSTEDRADVASELMRRVLLDTGGAMPRAESHAVTPLALRDVAKNLRRSITAQRAHDDAEAKRREAEYATTADAITAGASASLIAGISDREAERAVTALLAALNLTDDVDGPVWLTMYRYTLDLTVPEVAERRELAPKTAENRCAAGARMLANFWTLPQLAALIAAGGRAARHSGDSALLVLTDDSREAPHHWSDDVQRYFQRATDRTGTNGGAHPDRPTDADAARAACEVRKLAKSERVHWTKYRARRTHRDSEVTDATINLSRAYAQQSRAVAGTRRAPRTSTLDTALTNAR